MAFDGDNTTTARRRLLDTGKALFAQNGFEQTPTSQLAREAGTSESQLVRYYKTKAGLLEAIFNESWSALNQAIQEVVVGAPDTREALVGVLQTMTAEFGKDVDLAYLLLFEGRRIRGDAHEIFVSRGFRDFESLLGLLIKRGKRDGTFLAELDDRALSCALLGATESMIRERVRARRAGEPDPFTDEAIVSVFEALLTGLRSAPHS